eukprot:5622394-Lingulodinium_polyedra.AAC.1
MRLYRNNTPAPQNALRKIPGDCNTPRRDAVHHGAERNVTTHRGAKNALQRVAAHHGVRIAPHRGAQ